MFTETVTLSPEAMQRLRAEKAADAGASLVQPSSADLGKLMQRQSPGPGAVDLSKQTVVQTMDPPHWSDFSPLLMSPELGDEDRSRLADALQQATGFDRQVSNDPTVDLAVRKMKLDYIRDNLIPASLRQDAGSAIDAWVSHAGADMDQMSAKLDQMALDIARKTGHGERTQALAQDVAGYADGTASSQQYRKAMLGLVQGRQYGSREQARASAAASFADIRKALLEGVAAWPREQASGVAAVNAQIGHLQGDWASFVAHVAVQAQAS